MAKIQACRHSEFALGDQSYLSFQNRVIYLGVPFDSHLRPETMIEARIAKANAIMGAAKNIFRQKTLSKKLKGYLFRCLVLSTLFFGSESWILTDSTKNKLNTFFHNCLRAMTGVGRLQQHEHSINNAALAARVGLCPDIRVYYNQRALSWIGHIARMEDSRLPKKLMTSWLPNARPRGGGRANWGVEAKRSLMEAGIPTTFLDWHTLAQDRSKWRQMISVQAQQQLLIP
jgi:hypothetical protein